MENTKFCVFIFFRIENCGVFQEADASQQEENRVDSRRETPILTVLEESEESEKTGIIGPDEITQVGAHSFLTNFLIFFYFARNQVFSLKQGCRWILMFV